MKKYARGEPDLGNATYTNGRGSRLTHKDNNLKERRKMVREYMTKYNNLDVCLVPPGSSPESFKAIFESLSNLKKQRKSHKCRVAPEERFEEKGGTQRFGRMGLRGTLERFVSSIHSSNLCSMIDLELHLKLTF